MMNQRRFIKVRIILMRVAKANVLITAGLIYRAILQRREVEGFRLLKQEGQDVDDTCNSE
jgi:hypothetical protein